MVGRTLDLFVPFKERRTEETVLLMCFLLKKDSLRNMEN